MSTVLHYIPTIRNYRASLGTWRQGPAYYYRW